MATIYNLKPKELFEVPKDDDKTECKLCFQPAQPKDGIDLGPLYQYGNPITVENGQEDIEVYSAHYFCLLFAPALETNGEDEEGIKGFMPKDILKEWRRGQRLKCIYCKKSCATVGCVGKSCKKAYHLICGIRNGSHQEFCGSYGSYCSDHRPVQKVYKDQPTLTVMRALRECGICSDKIKPINSCSDEERRQHLWTPCCGKWWVVIFITVLIYFKYLFIYVFFRQIEARWLHYK